MKNLRKTRWIRHVMILSFIVPMLLASFGQTYAIGSGNIANNSYTNGKAPSLEKAAFPAALLVAAEIVAAAYCAGYAIGTFAHHAIDSFLAVNDPENVNLATYGYCSSDFSKFDN